MMGPTHRYFGALCGAAVTSWQGQLWPTVAMTALVATATSNGWSSPDMDQTHPWRRLARLSGPFSHLLAHRCLTHWFGLPVAAWWLVGSYAPPGIQWPAHALLIGWASHLLGDFIFGRVPLLPWGGRWQWGLGLTTGGFLETGRARWITLPGGPTRLIIVAGLVYVLAVTPGLVS